MSYQIQCFWRRPLHQVANTRNKNNRTNTLSTFGQSKTHLFEIFGTRHTIDVQQKTKKTQSLEWIVQTSRTRFNTDADVWHSEYGYFPVAISMTHIPKAYISAFVVYFSLYTSGAINSGVPTRRPQKWKKKKKSFTLRIIKITSKTTKKNQYTEERNKEANHRWGWQHNGYPWEQKKDLDHQFLLPHVNHS